MDNHNRNARRSRSPRRFTPQEEEHLRSLTPLRKRHLIRDDPRVREFFEEEEGRRVECDPRSFIHDVAESSDESAESSDESPEPEDIDFIDNTSGVSDSPSSGEHNETSSSSDHDDSGSDEEEESDSSSDGYEYTREPGTRAVADESDEEDEQVRAGQDEDNAPGDTGGRKRRADFGKSQQKKTKRGKREYSDSD
ncbi:hypothetical protein M3Y97_00267100 [Aphelenchoides bicaudatus]|nr:hypothetical protein M3Y97_00267100 [Aphelenchoides bicaudatus]